MDERGQAHGSADESNVIRVPASANVPNTAAVIAKMIYEGKRPQLRAIGAGAVNQAVKAAAAARGLVAARGIDLYVRPGFTQVVGRDAEPRDAITLSILVEE